MYLLWHAAPYEGYSYSEHNNWDELLEELTMRLKFRFPENWKRKLENWKLGLTPIIAENDQRGRSRHEFCVTTSFITSPSSEKSFKVRVFQFNEPPNPCPPAGFWSRWTETGEIGPFPSKEAAEEWVQKQPLNQGFHYKVMPNELTAPY